MERGPEFEQNPEVMLISSLRELSEPHYIDLEYHNFGHALGVLDEALRLADWCEAHDVKVNRRVLIAASLLHDAGFYEDPAVTGFDIKEKYSIFISEEILPTVGYASDEVALTSSCIASTQNGVRCESLEARIIRRADLANIAQKPMEFLVNTIRLHKEAQRLHTMYGKPGSPPGLAEYARKSYDFLAWYLKEDLSLGDFDKDHKGMCSFTREALGNIALLKEPTNGITMMILRQFEDQKRRLSRIGAEESADD